MGYQKATIRTMWPSGQAARFGTRAKAAALPAESYESFRVDVEQSRRMSEMTIAYDNRMAEAYWDGTRDHDVSQNYTAFLDAIENDPPYSILDLGCGPGRDLRHFRSLGHNAVGLDGSTEFVATARSYSGCEVLHRCRRLICWNLA